MMAEAKAWVTEENTVPAKSQCMYARINEFK